ncbi:hypothetical protein L204_102778 [Cryptococcus depauperatus]
MLANILFSVIALLVMSVVAAPAPPLAKRGLPRMGGVNLAGCEFGMDIYGTTSSFICPDAKQIAHFAKSGVNIFRIPFGWQYLVGSTSDFSSKTLDPSYLGTLDTLVQAALGTGSYVMLDLHNYGRWNNQIIGQGGPTNENFASVWSLLAKKYATENRIIFGIMNEPHDLNIDTFADSVQAAVNAIRKAGAVTQAIALPGNAFSNADAWAAGASDALLRVTDPAQEDKSLLIIDAHKYLDSDNNGKNPECAINGVDSMTKLASWLSKNGRKAIVSETGGGNTASCKTKLGEELQFISSHSDVFIGFAVWSAGAFAANYELSIVPNGDTDNELFTAAIKPYLPGSSGGGYTNPQPSSDIKSADPSTVVSSSVHTEGNSETKSDPVTTDTTGPANSQWPGNVQLSTSTLTITKGAPICTGFAGSNRQAFTGALGGIVAPAVFVSGTMYTCEGTTYNSLLQALSASCSKQMDKCQLAANAGGNKGELTVSACAGQQLQACISAASVSGAWTGEGIKC